MSVENQNESVTAAEKDCPFETEEACGDNQLEQAAVEQIKGTRESDYSAEMLISAYKSAVLEAKRAGEELEKVKRDNSPEKLYSGDEFVQRAIANPVVKEKIIENYLSGICDGESVTLMGASGVAVGAPCLKASTLKEAKRLADMLMSDKNY